jgi:SAM-dependent methyltransferase
VPPETLFSEYLYFSSFSDTMLRHAAELVARVAESERLGRDGLVIEIASNDGYLLQYYRQRNIPVLGIEPARNIAKVAEERGIRTLCEFFGRALALRLRDEGNRADVIHANNVLAHVPDLGGVMAGIEATLKERGVAIIEVPYVKDMIDHGEFDTIYHEHLCYFSLTSLDRLAQSHSLVIRDVERIAIHGGSLRVFLCKASAADRGPSVRQLLEEEARWGVADLAFYRGFAQRVERLRGSLRTLLHDLKRQGKRIAGYGAAAKATTLLNYFSIGADTIDFVVDRSTYKQNRYIPGVRIPIRAPSQLLDAKPDYTLLLTWNFKNEILDQQQAYRDAGGKFIVPIPEVRIV